MKIKQEHYDAFISLLEEINKNFPLDLETIKKLFEKIKFNFPGYEQCAIGLASSTEIRDKCLPYCPMISITDSPNHLSDYTGILELKIFDTRSGKVKPLFIDWLSLFPNGKLMFGMTGLILDSTGKNTVIDEYELAAQDKYFGDSPEVRKLRFAMVQSFHSEVKTTKEIQSRAIKILSATFTPQSN